MSCSKVIASVNGAYRAIYEIKEDTAKFVSVEEVSKHDY
jgi:hypothetical protein